MPDEPAASNTEQRRYWNEKGGPAWVANEDLYDEELAPLGRISLGQKPCHGVRCNLLRGICVVSVGTFAYGPRPSPGDQVSAP